MLLLILPANFILTQISYKSIAQTNYNSNSVSQTATSGAATVQEWDSCNNSLKRLDYQICLSDTLKRLEKNLETDYSNALNRMRKYFTRKDVKNLIIAQKNWQAYQETNCQAEEDTYREGTDAVGAGLQCKLRLTKERLGEIKNIYGSK